MADVYESQTTPNTYSEDDVYATVPTVTLQYINQAVSQPIDPSKQIPELSIVTLMLADAIITSAKIANAAIHSAHIDSAQIQDAHIDRASVNKLTVVSADIAHAQITDLHFDRASGNKIQILNGDIVNINASKLNAGTINTSLVSIQGNNANLKITGNRLQVFDTQAIPKERVSLGDVNADGTVFGLRVRGADGTTVLYDQNGVYSQGITNGAVTNPKIGDNAVDGRVIAADSVTAEHIVVTDLSAITANLGTVTAGLLKGIQIETIDGFGKLTLAGGTIQSDSPDDSLHAYLRNGILSTSSTYGGFDITDRRISHIQAGGTLSEIYVNGGKFNFSGSIRINAGRMELTSTSDDQALLVFETHRPWAFRQQGVDGNTKLILKCLSTDKFFSIQDSSGAESFFAHVSGTEANRYIYAPKIRTERIQGYANMNILNLGESHCYIDTTGDVARFQRDGNNYIAINSDNVTTYASGRGVISLRVGDNGTTHSFIQGQGSGLQLLGGGGVQVRNAANTAYGEIYATGLTPSSVRELKKNIVPFNENAIELIKGTPVYNYNYIHELDTELPHTGIMLDEAPVQLADVRGLGIELYSMVSVLWRGVQQLSSRVEYLENKQVS